MACLTLKMVWSRICILETCLRPRAVSAFPHRCAFLLSCFVFPLHYCLVFSYIDLQFIGVCTIFWIGPMCFFILLTLLCPPFVPTTRYHCIQCRQHALDEGRTTSFSKSCDQLGVFFSLCVVLDTHSLCACPCTLARMFTALLPLSLCLLAWSFVIS